MDAVVPGGDGDGAAADVDVALAVVVVVLRVEAVGPGGELQHAVRDADGVVGLDGLDLGGDHIGAAGDLQIVLAHDAVPGGADGQGTGAVQDQVALGEDHAVRVGVPVGGEAAGDGQGAVCGGGDEHLVGGLHIDHGRVRVGDAEPVQHQLHLVLLVRLHIDGGVLSAAGEHVDPGGGDADALAVGQGVGDGVGKIHLLLQVPIGEQIAFHEEGRPGGGDACSRSGSPSVEGGRGARGDRAGQGRGGRAGGRVRVGGFDGFRFGERHRPSPHDHTDDRRHDRYLHALFHMAVPSFLVLLGLSYLPNLKTKQKKKYFYKILFAPPRAKGQPYLVGTGSVGRGADPAPATPLLGAAEMLRLCHQLAASLLKRTGVFRRSAAPTATAHVVF